MRGAAHDRAFSDRTLPRKTIESPAEIPMTIQAGHPPRALRDPRADRRGRHGRGLPGEGHAPRAATSRSRSCRRTCPPRPSSASASSARRRRSRSSRTRTSARSTTSATRTAPTTSSWSTSRARRSRTGSAAGRSRSSRRSASAIEIADALDTAHRQRHRAPGPEARQRDADEVGREAARLRPREARRADASPVVSGDEPADGAPGEPAADDARHDPRDVPVHGAGAARGQGRRRAHRHLRVRLRALRDGDGPEGVHGQEPGVADRLDHDVASRRRSRRSSR